MQWLLVHMSSIEIFVETKTVHQYFTMFVQYINVFSVRSKKIKIKKNNCCEDQIKSHF